jgi:hypothetical protein
VKAWIGVVADRDITGAYHTICHLQYQMAGCDPVRG